MPALQTTDVEEARTAVAAVFRPHGLEPAPGPFRLRFRAARVGAIGTVDLDYGAPVAIDPECLEHFYLVQVPLAGSAWIRQGGQEIVSDPGTASVLSPDERITMRWGAGNPQITFYAERPAVDAHLTSLLGRAPSAGPLRFRLGMDLAAPAVRAWWRAFELLRAEIDDASPTLADAAAVRALEELLIGRLLAAQPHTYSDALAAPAPPAVSRTVRRACSLMDDRLAEPIVMTDLAAALGVSLRALQDGFRRELGTTPTAWVRQRRLSRAHDLLVSHTPASATVTDVATGVGLTHLGRFSVEYRRRYGEPPSQTLGRG